MNPGRASPTRSGLDLADGRNRTTVQLMLTARSIAGFRSPK